MERFIRQLLQQRSSHGSHEALCNALKEEGCLKTPEVVRAFESVDRAHFLWDGPKDEAYLNAPVKDGLLHQSAPSVYANALEALELTRPGLSFLNIGSGTGYFSALVAQLIGPAALHIGVERHEELCKHARTKCGELGLGNLQFICGNCYTLDIADSLRFDRIYVGAGAYRDGRELFKLLKSGGVIVGPFQNEESESQMLIKARRQSATKFAVTDRTPVQFAWLVRPSLEEDGRGPLQLRGPEWGRSTPALFPPRFKRMVLLFYWIVNYVEGSLPSRLPWDFWVRQIVPWLPFDAFDGELPVTGSNYESKCFVCGTAGANSACGRCKAIRYCSRRCQQEHWPEHKRQCRSTARPARAADAPSTP